MQKVHIFRNRIEQNNSLTENLFSNSAHSLNGRKLPHMNRGKVGIVRIRTPPTQEKASGKQHEGLGVSAGETSRECLAPRKLARGRGR